MTGADLLKRAGMEPDGARAVVEVTMTVEVGSWGNDCTVAQAAAQAMEGALDKMRRLLQPAPGVRPSAAGIKVMGAKVTRVICDAKPGGR